jgi:hypothetical protein
MSAKIKNKIHYWDDNDNRIIIHRKVTRIRSAKWLEEWGLKIGWVSIDGGRLKVCKYPSQSIWWIWDEGDGDI